MENQEQVTISGRIIWLHGLNPEKKHPREVVIRLGGGSGAASISKRVSKEDDWCWQFELPEIEQGKKTMNDFVAEAVVADYQVRYQGPNIICAHQSVVLDQEGNPTGQFDCTSSAAANFSGRVNKRLVGALIGVASGIWFPAQNHIG